MMVSKDSFSIGSRIIGLTFVLVILFALTGSAAVSARMSDTYPNHVPLAAAPSGQASTPVCQVATATTIRLPLVMRNSAGSSQMTGVAGPRIRPLRVSQPLSRVASPTNGSLGLQIAFVYDSDSATAQAFRTMLNGQGFHTFLLPLSGVSGADFSGCDVILLGSDTGAWTTGAARNAVLNAHLPVGAIGDGGLNFLSEADLLTGLTTGSGSGVTVVATSRGRDAYTFPNVIALAIDDSVQIYTSASSTKFLDLATPLPDGVEIGQLSGTTHYPIVQLQGEYLLWGFSAGPSGMTQAGQELFANALAFQGQGVVVPLRSRRFAPQPGVEQAFLTDLAASSNGLHAFIQLNDPPGDQACTDLTNLVPKGVTELYRVYAQTHVAFVAKSFNPNDALVAACLRWVGRILPADRTHPTVLSGTYPDWADNGDGTVDLLARFMPDVPDSGAEAVLDSVGATHVLHGEDTWAIVIAKTQVAALTQKDALRWLRPGPNPGLITNDDVRSDLFVDDVQDATVSGGSITYNGLTGNGVTIGVFDNGSDATQPDLAGAMLTAPGQADHGTHVAGMIASSGGLSASGGGTDFQWRGMAPEASLAAYISGWDGSEMDDALNTYGIVASNHSYVMTCGDYDGDAEDVDDLVRGDYTYSGSDLPTHLAIWAACNQGTSAQYCRQDSNDNTTGPRGFYSILSPAKNALDVGAVNPSTGYQLRSSSSRGPTWDGRIKPDVLGVGCATSTVPDAFLDRDGDGVDDKTYPYDSMCGTSMASPSVAGVTALVVQQYHETQNDSSARPSPEGLKALFINSATDLVQDPTDPSYSAYAWNDPDMGQPVIYYQGPDFSTGYGVVQARRAVEAVQHKDLIEADLSSSSDVDEYTFDVLADRDELRFTLAWSDPAGDPSLSNTALQLVNDLDLLLEDPNGGLHYPWVLDPLPAAADHTDGSQDPISQSDVDPAYPGMDHRNNVEQVVVWKSDLPGWAAWEGTWTVRVSATSVDGSTMPQDYALAGEWREITLQDVYPMDAGYNLAPDVIIIPVRVQNPHVSPSKAAGGISAANWAVRIGDSGSSIWSDATVESAYGPVGDLAYLVVRPPDTLSAGIYYDIEVTLKDVYQVDQRVAETYEPIDRATRTGAIFFLAEARAPVDEMIVMDNSGSMGDYGKLDSAKNAARAFADRREAGDKIGLAYFETVSNTLYNLTEVSAGEAELTSVKSMIDSMTDLDWTALGSGLLAGKDEFDAHGVPTHTWNIVLLSDGMENVPPCWDTSAGNPSCEGETSVQPDFVPAEGCPDIAVDTVILGPEDASWRSLLEDVASKTCGETWNATVDESSLLASAEAQSTQSRVRHYTNHDDVQPADAQATLLTFPQTLPNALADIYISIGDGNTHQQRFWEEAGILKRGEVISRAIHVEEGLPEATFAVNWPEPGSPLGMSLYRPSGPQVIPGDPDAHYKNDATHALYRMDAPDEGTWVLELGAKQVETSTVEYLAVASANSDVTMLLEFGLLPPQRVISATMPVYVVLVDKAGPIKNATVKVDIKRPGGAIDTLTMVDDGSHGDGLAGDGVYTNEYVIPMPGNYPVKAHALGTANDGQPFSRHRMRQFRVEFHPRVAYVWDTDNTKAKWYEQLLNGNGLPVTLVTMADVATTDFSPFQLIIIGPDTGKDAVWGDAAKVNQINRSGRPVLGLGDGGYAFFGKLKLNIGYNHGVQRADAAVLAVDPTHVLWNEPYDVALGAGAPVATVYQGNGSPGVAINLDQGMPGVELLARRPSESSLYWLAREQARYLLWGFNYGPTAMTENGKELFVNTAWYAFP